MSAFNAALQAAIAKVGPGVRIIQATFMAGSDGSGCLIDIQGSRIPALLGTTFLPEVGENVWVWVINDMYFIMGSTAVKPDQGTVVSASGGLATLTTSVGTTIAAPYVGAAPSAGQVMKLLWHNGPFAMLMSTSPAPAPPPPPPPSGATTHTHYFAAIDAGSYGSRWWTDQVWASDNNLGAWFYGSKISDTIPAAAAISSVQIYISPQQISGSAPNFALHPYQVKPGGSPSYSLVTAIGVGGGGWLNLPTSFGNGLKAGGGSAGVGVDHGGYNIFNSLAADGQSGALSIVSIY
jgi:hypothetical protein